MTKTVVRRGFRFRKLADYAAGRRVGGDGLPMESWPLLGVTFEEPPPEYAVVPEGIIVQAYKEGWVELENPESVTRPAGPPHAPWAGKAGTSENHTFLHADAVIFHMVEGDYRYRVAQNPDKQHPNRVGTGGDVEGGEVSHVYLLDLESAPKAAA